MKVAKELELQSFEFWSGAVERTKNLTTSDFEVIENELNNLYPDGMDETELNDLFWFEFDFVAQLLGYTDEEEFNEQRGV